MRFFFSSSTRRHSISTFFEAIEAFDITSKMILASSSPLWICSSQGLPGTILR